MRAQSARLRRWFPGFASRRPGSSALAHARVVNAALTARQQLPRAARIDSARLEAGTENHISSRFYAWHGTGMVTPVAARALGDAKGQRGADDGFCENRDRRARARVGAGC